MSTKTIIRDLLVQHARPSRADLEHLVAAAKSEALKEQQSSMKEIPAKNCPRCYNPSMGLRFTRHDTDYVCNACGYVEPVLP